MDRDVRVKREMGVRVRDFSRQHPSADANHASVVLRLDGAIVRIDEVAGQQVGGFLSKHASVVRRKQLRRELRDGLLRHLVTAAESAAVEDPTLVETFHLPPITASTTAFQTVARKMLEQGIAKQDLLAKHGLGTTLLDELKAAVEAYDASVAATNDGLQAHVTARAELAALSQEVMLLVGMLDGINQYRFRHEPQLLAGWETAKHVVAGPQAATVENPDTPAGPVQPGPGEVKPAA
jgi:hypothetical protein